MMSNILEIWRAISKSKFYNDNYKMYIQASILVNEVLSMGYSKEEVRSYIVYIDSKPPVNLGQRYIKNWYDTLEEKDEGVKILLELCR